MATVPEVNKDHVIIELRTKLDVVTNESIEWKSVAQQLLDTVGELEKKIEKLGSGDEPAVEGTIVPD